MQKNNLTYNSILEDKKICRQGNNLLIKFSQKVYKKSKIII